MSLSNRKDNQAGEQPMAYIILDRDGVINYDSVAYIKTPQEWRAIPGSLQAIAALNRAGFEVLIATNQSGIARGLYNYETLEMIHQKLRQELKIHGGEIKEIFFCPHHPAEHCQCRKPNPGMFEQIRKKYSIKLDETYFIGDSFTDIKAARSVGCQPILVLTGNGQDTLARYPELQAIPNFENLIEAAGYVIAQSK